MWVPCCVCFHFLSGQDRVRTCEMAYKEISAGATSPPEKQRVSAGSGEPRRCVRHYFPGINFSLRQRNKEHVLCIVNNFLGFLGYCQACIMKAAVQQSFPSYHKLACMAPLLSPQSSSNCCNWTSALLSSKRRCSIAYAPNALDNESRAAGQEGRRARCCSVNKFQSH